MAEVPTVLTSGLANTGAAATTTASVTPIASGAVLVVMYANKLSAFTDTTTVSGCGLTWTKVATVLSALDLEILTVFVGYGGSPSAGTIVITLSGTAVSGNYAVIEQAGQDTSANPAGYSNSASGTGTTGTVAMVIANRTVGRRVFSFWGHRINEVVTPDSTGITWTELHDAGTTLSRLEVQYEDGIDESATATWATSSTWSGIAMELKAALYSSFRSNVLDAIDNTPSYDNWGTPSAGGEGRGVGNRGVSWNIIGSSANATERSKSKLRGLVG